MCYRTTNTAFIPRRFPLLLPGQLWLHSAIFLCVVILMTNIRIPEYIFKQDTNSTSNDTQQFCVLHPFYLHLRSLPPTFQHPSRLQFTEFPTSMGNSHLHPCPKAAGVVGAELQCLHIHTHTHTRQGQSRQRLRSCHNFSLW